MGRNSKEKANALIIVLAILFTLSVMVVTFAKLSTAEMVATTNHVQAMKARLFAEAGIQQAIGKLRQDFRRRLFCNHEKFITSSGASLPSNWAYRANDETTAIMNGIAVVDDFIADGISIEKIQTLPDSRNPKPSYTNGTALLGRHISEVMGTNEAVTMKVFDVNSQLDLNSQIVPPNPADGSIMDPPQIPMIAMIENLSRAIAARPEYQALFSGDQEGPFFADDGTSLAQAIIVLRDDLGGFSNKLDLLQIPNLNRQKFNFAFDYFTVHAPKRAVVARNERLGSEMEPYRPDSRAPINVNTASWPVLFAAISGLSAIDPENTSATITISPGEAVRIANEICLFREIDPFFSWDDFQKRFLNQIKTSTTVFPSGNGEAKTDVLMANFNPNVHLRRTNADKSVYQPINKTDLVHYTTEFCFYPHGVFEIQSLGQVLNPQGEVLFQNKKYTVVRVFSTMHKNGQLAFQNAQIIGQGNDPFTEKSLLHAFSYPNNQQRPTDPVPQENENFGHIQPVVVDNAYEFDQTSVVFKENFNEDLGILATPIPSALSNKNKDQLALPNVSDGDDTFDFGDMLPDGVAFYESGVAPATRVERTLCYDTVMNAEQGTLAFWFKPNENITSSLKTVFFATKVIDPIQKAGIQMEIKMGHNRTTGAFTIKAQRKYYGPPAVPVPAFITGDLNSIVTYFYNPDTDFGIKAHEWCLLVVHWRNGTDLFVGSPSNAIELYGNFYEQDTNGELQNLATQHFVNAKGGEATFSETSNSSDFNPLIAEETEDTSGVGFNEGKMYFGSCLASDSGAIESLAMTLDDLRIFDTITTVSVVPSRYPRLNSAAGEVTTPDPNGGPDLDVISKFNGTFTNQPSNHVVLGVMDWTLRSAGDTVDKSRPFLLNNGGILSSLDNFDIENNNPVQKASFGETHTLLISQRREMPNAPVIIRSMRRQIDDLGGFDAVQLGVKVGVWGNMYEEMIERMRGRDQRRTLRRVTLQDFINTFGAMILAKWNEVAVPRGFDRLEDMQDRGDMRERVDGVRQEEFFEELFRPIFGFDSRRPNAPRDLEALIAVVNANLGVPLQQFNGVQLGAGAIPQRLGIEIVEDLFDIDDRQAKRLDELGRSISDTTGAEIEVLPQLTNFDFQLKFVSEPLVPQFVAPVIDDLTLTYQDLVEIIVQFNQ